jgi:hypothetical protein
MAFTNLGSGTQSAAVGTEHTLVTDTTGHTCIFVVDTVNMVNGDVLELRLYTKVLSGGAESLAYSGSFAHAQAEPVKYSVPVPADVSIKATLKQTAGTSRNFDWKLLGL